MHLKNKVLGISNELRKKILSQHEPDQKLADMIQDRLQELNIKHQSEAKKLSKVKMVGKKKLEKLLFTS